MTLSTPIDAIKGVTKNNAAILKSMGIETVKDLIFYFPRRCDEFTIVIGEVECVANRRSFRRRMTLTEATIVGGKGKLIALWFHQPYLAKTLKVGAAYRFAGKVTPTKFGPRLINPLHESAEVRDGYVRPIMPVYPTSAGVSQHTIRKLLRECEPLMRSVDDPLSVEIRAKYELIHRGDALVGAHFPSSMAQWNRARRRIAFDELLRLQLAVGRTKRLRGSERAAAVAFDEQGTKAFVRALPFALTGDQRKAAWAILTDMARPTPMHRLLDGDVGSGKTVVAAIATLNAAAAGFQSALMAPTEILARQHFETLSRMYAGRDIAVALWTNAYKRSSTGSKEIACATKKESGMLAAAIANGGIDVVVGTHALVEEGMRFSSLALAVVDEQHRFGVRIRQELCAKSGVPGRSPHLLSMTATPIPRSLALAVYGDLDLSVLKEKPAGRKDTVTRLVPKRGRAAAYRQVRAEVAAGRQAFVVCPLIDPSDAFGALSVAETVERLRTGELKGLSIGTLHGKMSAAEKEKVMNDFLERRIAVLVSTSVVEVGVDVPNATVMCIEGAERFGLAQLHQFRGRIGRGVHQSYCFLLPSMTTAGVKERLEAVARTNDGFALAEKDLEMRGPGDVLGTAQSGFPEFAAASFGDAALIAAAKEAAEEILKNDPDLRAHEAMRAEVGATVEKAHLE